jgi:hypothetical protein
MMKPVSLRFFSSPRRAAIREGAEDVFTDGLSGCPYEGGGPGSWRMLTKY